MSILSSQIRIFRDALKMLFSFKWLRQEDGLHQGYSLWSLLELSGLEIFVLMAFLEFFSCNYLGSKPAEEL
jgi:hypothetical protein